MGTYSYGTKVTQPSERAQRLARFDGFETLANMLGFLASPSIFAKLGYLGVFSICEGMIGLAIIYIIFFIEEPKVEIESPKEKEKFNFRHLIVKSFVVLTLRLFNRRSLLGYLSIPAYLFESKLE